MTNLSTLIGFGAGGSGSGSLPAIVTDVPTLVDSDSSYFRGSAYNQQGSPTYQAFHQLSTDGVFGGLFDPYYSAGGGVVGCGFYVNPATGSLGSLNTSSAVWNPGNAAIFSTCHHGACGMMVMNVGHNNNSSYSTNKGWVYAYSFSSTGVPQTGAQAAAPQEAWPHSNGDLAMGMDNATSGTLYGRRSTYNSNNSRYYHSANYATYNGSASYSEWSDISSNTSTNYCTAAAKNSKGDLTPGGMICYYNSSGIQRISPIYGSTAARGSDYDANLLGFASAIRGFHLSNGETLWYYDGKVAIQSSSQLNVPGTTPAGVGLLTLINGTNQLRSCIPTNETDTWICSTSGYGLIKLKIDINDNYKVTILGLYNTLGWLFTQSMNLSGTCLGLVGSNDEYLVYTAVSGGGLASRYVYENPFAS